MKPYLIAGLIAGAAGLITFLIIHHFWIRPIWFILPVGLIIAGLGGLAVGWAYGILLPHLPSSPWRALSILLLIMAILAPAIILSALRPPVFDIITGKLLADITVADVVRRFILELLVPSLLMGALLGGLIGRSQQAIIATALAGFVFALGPGHNIPLLAGTPGIPKGTAILLGSSLAAAVVLVQVEAHLAAPLR